MHLADRVRRALPDPRRVREVKMFGGLAFMVDGRMAVCVPAGGGALLVRVAPEKDSDLVSRPGARRGEMGKGRSMGEGWIAIDERAVEFDPDLQHWIDAALDVNTRGDAHDDVSPGG